ncbi:hypothetical protein CXIVA_00530 [Clostridium sp. SY8519]|nr:hypothetical protein CXIVA_00530 [Clostridium sp. SY8519]
MIFIEKKKMGRPTDNPKTERLYIRVAPDEKKQIQEFMADTGRSLLELIETGIKAIKRETDC